MLRAVPSDGLLHRPVVVITGASAGVGRATARAYAAQGAHVGLLSRGSEGLVQAVREVERGGGRALAIPTDVSDPTQVESAAAQIEDALGPIDLWVNDAMVTVMSPVAETSAEEYRRVTEVTYLGVVHGTLSALRRMQARDRGTIVQVGSALAYRAIPLQSAYCAAKHAIRGFTDSLRCELMHTNSAVRVTMVQLPALNTPQFEWSRLHVAQRPQPVPPIFQPELAAQAIVFAARAGRREVWLGGRNALLILLNKLAPGVGDRYLAHTGYASQLTAEPADPERRDNLYEPLQADFGPRGRFDARASTHSLQLRATQHRGLVAAAAGALALVAWLIHRARG